LIQEQSNVWASREGSSYCLLITLKNRLQALAPGLTPKAVLENLATIQMLDVWLPTTDGRWLVMPRFTQPEADQAILLHKLKLDLPQQPPPRIRTRVPEFPPEALRMWCRPFPSAR
jgi:hypothetical protein